VNASGLVGLVVLHGTPAQQKSRGEVVLVLRDYYCIMLLNDRLATRPS